MVSLVDRFGKGDGSSHREWLRQLTDHHLQPGTMEAHGNA
jgi:hypothetical protein